MCSMATNLALDDNLIEEARQVGGHRTKKDAVMAETAYRQVEAAFKINRTNGYAPFASYYEERLSEARAILNRLSPP